MRVEGLAKVKLPRPIILVTGAFDLMHVGHMRLLFMARDRAGVDGTVICAMNSDNSVTASKGAGRPIMTWVERASTMAYMPIDVLVEFDSEAELRKLTSLVEPDLQICGPDYMNQPTTAGVPVACIREASIRTSTLIDRIKKIK
jgi:bifunctional ADP-heptose synthase (sugar kinase/adenylyltransferase)